MGRIKEEQQGVFKETDVNLWNRLKVAAFQQIKVKPSLRAQKHYCFCIKPTASRKLLFHFSYLAVTGCKAFWWIMCRVCMQPFHKSCAKSPATRIKTFLRIFIRRVCYFSGFGNSLSFEGHRRNVRLSLFPYNSYLCVGRHVPECVWAGVNTERLHMFHLHLQNVAFTGLEPPWGWPSTFHDNLL